MDLVIPGTLKKEHKRLHSKLAKAVREGGEVGAAAIAVRQLLHPHFLKEEEFALPPLGLLVPLAKGEFTVEMRPAVEMADRLRKELLQMLDEHKRIVSALEKLIEASEKADKKAHARFARQLMLHAQNEEEVLYPAAMLIGDYLKLRLA